MFQAEFNNKMYNPFEKNGQVIFFQEGEEVEEVAQEVPPIPDLVFKDKESCLQMAHQYVQSCP